MQQFFSGYIALGTGSTSFVELTAADYLRQYFVIHYVDVNMAESSSGAMWSATSNWPTVTQMALFDIGNNCLASWSLPMPFKVLADNSYVVPPGWRITVLGEHGNLLYPAGTTIGLLADGTRVISEFVQFANGALMNNPAAPKSLPLHDPYVLNQLWNNNGIVTVSNGPLPLIGSAASAIITDVDTDWAGSLGSFMFHDIMAPRNDLSAIVDWGDGHTTSDPTITGGNGIFIVSSDWTWVTDGSYTVSATLTRTSTGDTATVTLPASVKRVIAVTPLTVSPAFHPGHAFTRNVATFTDSGTTRLSFSAASFAATIDWGDESNPSTGVISGSGPTFSVAGTHAYAEDGTYDVVVSVNEVAADVVDSATSTAVAAPGPIADPHFANVALLCHFDGADGSTSFVDSSPTPKVFTPINTPALSTTQFKFGTASWAPGTVHDGSYGALSIPSDSFTLGSTFTIEAWVYFTSEVAYGNLLTQVFAFLAYLDMGGSVTLHTPDANAFFQFDPFVTDTWMHVAIDLSGGTSYAYINGVPSSPNTDITTIGTSDSLINIGARYLGGDFYHFFDGYIDDLRVTVGTARYGGVAFEPPSDAFLDQ